MPIRLITQRKRVSLRSGDTRSAILMLLPFMLFFLAFVIYPVLMNFYYSLTNYNFGGSASRFIGLNNYLRLFRDTDFIVSLRNTIIYAFFNVTLLTVLGLLLAVILNRKSRFVDTIRTAMIFPYAASIVAVSLIWLLMLDPGPGIVNSILVMCGVDTPPSWLYDPNYALGALVIIGVWKNTGYIMIIFLAGLQTVTPELYEAAGIDGAGAVRKLWNITLPSIKPVTVFVLITSLVEAFKTFEQIKIMTKGGPMLSTSTIVYQIYIRAFEDFQMGYAAAQSVTLLFIILAITLINFKNIVRGQS